MTRALFVSLALLLWCPRVEAAPKGLQPIAVTASSTYAGTPATNVVDGNPATVWNAGGFATQWIELDLGRTVALWKIRLLVAQEPSGLTSHSVYVGQDPGNLRLVKTFTGTTSGGQWLEHTGDGLSGDHLGQVRYVRITTTQSPSWVAWSEIEVFQGVEHLGYFASAFDGHGTGDHTAETAAVGANVTWIATAVSTLAGKLAEAKRVGSKAILVLNGQLFSSSPLAPSADWQAQWEQVRRIILDGGYEDTVLAFYPLDEPYHNAWVNNVSDATMRGWLQAMSGRMHADFPSKPVGTILAYPTLTRGLGSAYVSMFDWVGFDCYGPWDNCNGQSMPWYISTLRSWLSPSQRMIAVPEAFRWDAANEDLLAQNLVIGRLNAWHKEVLSDGKYVAVAPFLWPSLDLNANGQAEQGTRDMRWVRERLYQFSRSLLHPEDTQIFPVDAVASASWDWGVPFAATNRDLLDSWAAGGVAPQWIEYDFGGSTQVRRIELVTNQYPSGATVHHIYGAATLGAWSLLGTIQGFTQDQQQLVWTGTANVRWIRVATSQSPSWVAWREIRFFE
ncbi:discoidin domain-containing protein [Stigmatella sp. ncwal1]|uniref:Discoidin domain-containing protein n=1 Tax=Stigmatella ashevillensis TaxID=2995309 RepID=A0ABT5DDQ8_9BACT|nr:discoidin domain-containing protein [Stigmatella ashevillena]MDC0711787.1 discoidin domain-containing protein [Stigmatella ashevillena]